ncbi:MAG TPA: hypothetical protein VK911_16275, partial [Vicinamibacterales bacterium]|nr:hypothetical protein [Vicinamibacterales bacterium]
MIDRKEFLTASWRAGCCALIGLGGAGAAGQQGAAEQAPADPDKQFIQNWLTDLLRQVDTTLDEPAKAKLLGGCGRACFERFAFKRAWAEEGRGDVEKLIAALQRNFDVRREGQQVHIRYGAISKGCYCPAAKYREPAPNDLHCYCSRGTHQAVWETALGRPVQVEIAESVRRGGKT